MNPLDDYQWRLIAVAAFMSALIGLGQLLNSDVQLSWRYVVGRALVSAGLGACAPVALLWFPAMPPVAEFAIAALLASVGTSVIQNVVIRFFGNRP